MQVKNHALFLGGFMHQHKLEDLDFTTLSSMLSTYTTEYSNIKSRRYSLLTLLPTITAGGVALTIFGAKNNTALLNLTLPLGIGGVILVIGLFCIAIAGARDSEEKLKQIRQIEYLLGNLPNSQMTDTTAITKFGIGLLFSFAISGWVCLALWFTLPGYAPWFALFGLIVSFFISYPLLLRV